VLSVNEAPHLSVENVWPKSIWQTMLAVG